MKTRFLIPVVLLSVAVSGSVALAQDASAASPAVPAAPEAKVVAASEPVTVNGVVYTEKLPTPTSLLKDAETEGLKIVRMDQSPDRMIVVYQYPDNTTRAFAYTTSVSTASSVSVASAPVRVVANPTGSSASYTVISEPAPTATVVYTQPNTVYYTEPAPVYYSPRYYDPVWDGWAPFAVGLGLGVIWHDGYHGGYRGYHGWRH